MCFDVDVWHVCVSHVLTAALVTTHAVDAPVITTQPEARRFPFFAKANAKLREELIEARRVALV